NWRSPSPTGTVDSFALVSEWLIEADSITTGGATGLVTMAPGSTCTTPFTLANNIFPLEVFQAEGWCPPLHSTLYMSAEVVKGREEKFRMIHFSKTSKARWATLEIPKL